MSTYRFIHKETRQFTAHSLATLETQTTKSYNMYNKELHLETSKIQDEIRVMLQYGGGEFFTEQALCVCWDPDAPTMLSMA